MKTVKIPFDLELAKAGHPVCTRDGRAVRILCHDFISPKNNPIIALVKLNEKQEGAIFYGLNGKGSICDLDLMMTPQKKEGWVNVFINASYFGSKTAGTIYPTKEEALKDVDTKSPHYIDTVKIEWEE